MNEQINCIATHCIKITNEIGAHYFAHEKSAGHLSVSESERVVYKRVVAIGILCGFFYISCHSPISQWIRYSLCVVSIFCEFCAWNRPIKYSNQTLQTSIFMSDVDGRDKILIRPASLPLNLRIRIFQQYEIRAIFLLARKTIMGFGNPISPFIVRPKIILFLSSAVSKILPLANGPIQVSFFACSLDKNNNHDAL